MGFNFKKVMIFCFLFMTFFFSSFVVFSAKPFTYAWHLNNNETRGLKNLDYYRVMNLSQSEVGQNLTTQAIYGQSKKTYLSHKYLYTSASFSFAVNNTYLFWLNTTDKNIQLTAHGLPAGYASVLWYCSLTADGYITCDFSTGAAGCGGFRTTSYNVANGKWHLIAITQNATHSAIIVDGNISRGVNWFACAHNTGGSQVWTLGEFGGSTCICRFDEVMFSKNTYSERNVLNIYTNYSAGLPFPFTGVGVPAVSSSLSVFAKNLSGVVKRTRFGEGEDFRVYSNFTLSNGSVLSGAVCNVTVPLGVLEWSSVKSNFTVCSSGCGATSYFEKFSGLPLTNAVYDIVHFRVCRPSVGVVSLSVNLCGDVFTVSGGAIPSCASGNASVFLNSSKCKLKASANFTISNSANFVQRHSVSRLGLDRQFSSFFDRLIFNVSKNFYGSNHSFEYYSHGSYTLAHACSQGSYSNSANNVLTIVNAVPTIFLHGLENLYGFKNFTTSSVIVDFSSGYWQFFGSVLDDDLDTVQYIIRNSTQQIYKLVSRVGPVPYVNVSYTYFLKQGGYNFTVIANDTFKNKTMRSALFGVVDTFKPQCSGIVNTSVLNNTFQTWNVTCSDDYFWLFNATCDNGFRYFKDSIANQSFRFLNRTRVVDQDLTCKFFYCDGHTANDVGSLSVEADVSKDSIIADSVVLVSNTDLKSISLKKESDRFTFCISPADPKASTVSFKIPDGCVLAKNSRFPGHLVCEKDRVWIDFVSSEVPVSVVGSDIVLDVGRVKDPSNICFSSIGRLNCINQTQVSSVTFPPGLRNQFGSNLQAWSFFFVLIIWLAFLLMSLLITGGTGRRMGILGLAQLFMGILLAVFCIPVFSLFFATIILFTSIGCFAAVLSG